MKKAFSPVRKGSRSARAGLVLAAAVASFSFGRHAAAITGTWIDTDANSNWSDGNNWGGTGGVAPGNDTGTINNGDTALFNNSVAPVSNTVNLDTGNWNILNITFDTVNANSFLIGSTSSGANSLVLSSGGSILETSTVTSAASELINAPVVLEGNYTFENDASPSASGLKFNGNVSGGVSGPVTLILQGSNLATTGSSGTTATTNDQIIGEISNGSSSALNIVKNGAGAWDLASTGTSTYTGTTTVNAGFLVVTTAGGTSAATDVVVNNLGSIFESGAGAGVTPTIHSLTLNSFTSVQQANANCTLSIASNTGPALIVNDQSATTGASPVAANITLSGTGPAGTGGIISLVNTAYTSHLSFTKNFDLGTTSHLIYQNAGTGTPNSSTDLQINALVSGDSSGGGIIKSGNGVVKFQDTGTEILTFTGPIEIQEGSIKQVGNGTSDQFSGVNTLLIDGGNFNLDGGTNLTGDATFGAVVMTSGSTSAVNTASTSNTIFAPSFTFNVAAGNTFSAANSFGDESGGMIIPADGTAAGTSALTINGPGQVTMSGDLSTYSGGTTINAGNLVVNANASGTPLGTGSVAINGSTVSLDPSATVGMGIAINFSVASLSGTSQLIYGGGNTLNIKQGNETNITLTVGNASASGSVLSRVNNGTLVIAAALGTANLGGTEQLILKGTAPTLTNGIVNTAIVGQNNDSNASGDFLTYGANGFALGTYSASTNINTAGSSAVYNGGTGSNNNALSGPASVYALNTAGQTIDTGSSALSVGDGIAGHQAGVILNGGSIISSGGTGSVAFGADEGTVYTSKAGATISANITGSGGLTTFGLGKLILGGSNTGLTGGLNLNQGTVNVSVDANLGASTNPINFGGGTLQFASSFVTAITAHPVTINSGGGTIDTQSGTITVGSNIGGAGNLTKVGTGNLVLTGSNSYGATTISAGNVQIGTGGSLGSGNVTDNAGLIFASSGSPNVSNVISGSGTVTQNGAGVVGLSGNNSYAGATAINSGSIQVGNANALGFGGANTGASVAVATVNSSGTLDLNAQTLNKPITLNGGTLTNGNTSAAGGLSTGVNGYFVTSGGSAIPADLVTVSGGGGSGASAKLLLGLTNASITTVAAGTGYATAPTVTISGGGGTGATAVATISSGGVASVTITNPGVGYFGLPSFSFSGGGGTGAAVTANQNNFTAVGAQAILPGSGYTSAPTAAAFTIDSSAGTVTEVAPTITAVVNTVNVQASSTINGAGAVVLNTAVNGAASSGTVTLNLDGTSSSSAINGVISNGTLGGSLALSKTNSSVWTLTGANTFSGGTVVNAGTLDVSNTSGSATGSGNVTLNGGVLASDSGSISGNVLAGSGAHTIAPGGIGSIGTLTIGGLTSSSLTTLNFDLGTGSGTITNGDLLNLGAGTVNVGTGTLLTFGGSSIIGDDYQLIGGSISGINLANLSLPTAPAGQSYSLSKIGGFVDLVVASGVVGPANLTWNDASGNNLWDTAASSNWNNGTTTTVFNTSDNVTFNDSNGASTGRYAVTLNTAVSPGSVTFSNSSGNYSISGTGGITGTTALTKSGSGTVTLSTLNTYTGGTSVSAGVLVIAPTTPVSTTLSALGKGALTISGSGAVVLASNATLGSQSSPTPASNVNITSLVISGSGTLDIKNNHIIIDYTPGHDPIASIAALIVSGFNGGGANAWTGTGITSTSALANASSYGIGYADSADVGNPAGLVSGQIEVMYTLLGDANLDGKVNGSDFAILATNFNKAVGGWDQGDFNYDGKDNGADFTDLAANFNKGASQAADLAALESFAVANGLQADVPEPASLGLVTMGTIGILARRRRKTQA